MGLRKAKTAGLLLSIALALGACSFGAKQQPSTVKETKEKETGFILTGPDSYDSEDTAILLKKNEKEESLTFLNLDLGRKYTLTMDGTTKLYNKYGESISLGQLEVGDIVEVTFLKEKKHANSVQLSEDAWERKETERYEIDGVKGEVTVGEDVYKLSTHTQYFSGGKPIEAIDINKTDSLTIRGIDTTVLSISVDRGHGYLRLANAENFIGGWIEIGQTLICHITEEMLLTVPEGSYKVNISKNGSGGIKPVIINRNEETTLDIGDLEVAEVQYGTVLFSITPSDADVYIDAAIVDTTGPIKLTYGIHQLIVKATGYQSITRYLSVNEPEAAMGIDLEPVNKDGDEDEEEEEEEESDSEEDSDDDEEDTLTGYYKVYIDAPEEVEVYLDGSYVGISPTSFRKEAGTHVITLRKTGYITRSYTVQIDQENRDFSYSFVDLIPGEEKD